MNEVVAAMMVAFGLVAAAPRVEAQVTNQTTGITADGQARPPSPQAGANSVLVPDVGAQVPTTRNTNGASPSDDSNSASARGGPGTGPITGNTTGR